MKQIITSLDVGSDTIKIVVGEIYKEELLVLACAEVKSNGIKKGIVVNPEEAIECLKDAFKRVSDVLGIKIDKVVLSVPSYYTEIISSDGYTTINREDKRVNGDDLIRALQACVYNKVPSNKELVAIMPVEYWIDDVLVEDPKNKEASRLSVNTLLALVPKKNIYGIISLLDSLEIKVLDISIGGLSDYFEYRIENWKDKQVAVVNIGSYKTEVSIIENDVLVSTETLDIGGRNIDRDISYIYDINKKDAIKLKENFALAHKKHASTSETEDCLTKNKEHIKINQYEVSEIVYSRLKEILELTKKQINLLTKKGVCYIIVTGGSTEIEDFTIVKEEVFGRDTENLSVKEMGVRNNKFSSALGIIKYYATKLNFRDKIATTIDSEKQEELFKEKKKFTGNSLLGKVYGYFFDN